MVAALVLLRPGSTGTLLLLAAASSPDRLPEGRVAVHTPTGWREVGEFKSRAVPAAPAFSTELSAALPPGSIDVLRIGDTAIPVRAQVGAGLVEPLLLGVKAGRIPAAAVYAGNDEVNLGLSELAGNLTPLPDFELVDQSGRRITKADLAGRDVVVAAFHTTCHETCPIYTGLFMQLRRLLPATVVLLEATTDPEVDSPDVLRDYSRRVGARWTLATGTPADVKRFWEPFQVGLGSGDSHVSTLALVDRHGYIRLVYRGVPHVDAMPEVLRAQLSSAGRQQLANGGEGWGAAQIVDRLHSIGGLADAEGPAGGAAPAFKLRTMQGGDVSLDDFRGRPVVINFWASWCAACTTEMPLLEAQARAQPRVSLLLLDYRDDPAAARAFLQRIHVSAPAALDADGAIGDRYSVRGLPVTVFVRADGTVAGSYTGEMDRSTIQAHLADIAGS
jgi:cytochrome oxidase Cu insertion factor (SCO1/SenC/PrrC family)